MRDFIFKYLHLYSLKNNTLGLNHFKIILIRNKSMEIFNSNLAKNKNSKCIYIMKAMKKRIYR